EKGGKDRRHQQDTSAPHIDTLARDQQLPRAISPTSDRQKPGSRMGRSKRRYTQLAVNPRCEMLAGPRQNHHQRDHARVRRAGARPPAGPRAQPGGRGPSCGVHWTQLDKVERGQRSLRLETIVRIADGLEIAARNLVGKLPEREKARKSMSLRRGPE